MKNSMKTLSAAYVGRQALLTAIAVAVAVVLPQLCHLLGGQLGVGTSLGEMLLPMHLPVMLAGLLWVILRWSLLKSVRLAIGARDIIRARDKILLPWRLKRRISIYTQSILRTYKL